jgi:hypothetical protein
MREPIARYLADDHVRLDALLTRGASEPAACTDFRRGLLRGRQGVSDPQIWFARRASPWQAASQTPSQATAIKGELQALTC